jgi:hypothetical protein
MIGFGSVDDLVRPVRLGLIGAALGLVALLIAPFASEGRVVPRDGLWGGSVRGQACDESGCVRVTELGLFKLRARKVRQVGYNVLVACYNRDTRATYDVFFTVTKRRATARLDSRGVARFTREERSDGRIGRVSVTIDFSGRRPLMKVRIAVGGRIERCNGNTTLPVKASPR